MKLIVGGAHQGKLDYAKKLVCGGGLEEECEVADGEADSMEAALSRPIVNHFHGYVRRFFLMAGGREELFSFLSRLEKENPRAVIVSNTLGCGIVPMEPADRLWRELTGEAEQFLAARSEFVCRVICGLPQILKGGER